MQTLLSNNVLSRAGWTALQAVVALGIVELADIKTWWAAPIAMVLSALKTNVVDRLAAGEEVGP